MSYTAHFFALILPRKVQYDEKGGQKTSQLELKV